MSYDFSFQKSQMWLLGVLVTLMAVLLVTAGFLIGRITVTSTTSTAVAVPVAPVAQPVVKIPAAPVVAAPVVTIPQVAAALAAPAAAAPAADVVQLTPPAADNTSTVAINTASSSGNVYQLAASGYALQYGAFRNPANARDLMKQLTEQKVIASVVAMQNAYGESYSVVRSGTYPTVSDARQAAVDQANRLRMPIVVRPAGRL